MTPAEQFIFSLHSLAPIYVGDILILDSQVANAALARGWADKVKGRYRLGVKVRLTELAVTRLEEYLSEVSSDPQTTPLKKVSNG